MPKKELIIALKKSSLDYDPSIIPQLWTLDNDLPEHIIDLLLTSLESAEEEYPEILNLLLTESGLSCTCDAQKKMEFPLEISHDALFYP
jgi:hypothetical protein